MPTGFLWLPWLIFESLFGFCGYGFSMVYRVNIVVTCLMMDTWLLKNDCTDIVRHSGDIRLHCSYCSQASAERKYKQKTKEKINTLLGRPGHMSVIFERMWKWRK